MLKSEKSWENWSELVTLHVVDVGLGYRQHTDVASEQGLSSRRPHHCVSAFSFSMYPNCLQLTSPLIFLYKILYIRYDDSSVYF